MKLPKPILAKAESWHQQPLFCLKVMTDPGGDLFRMWCNVKNPGAHPSVCFAYAESECGIHWRRPNLGIVASYLPPPVSFIAIWRQSTRWLTGRWGTSPRPVRPGVFRRSARHDSR